jgi:hypothetical protein
VELQLAEKIVVLQVTTDHVLAHASACLGAGTSTTWLDNTNNKVIH